MINWQISFEVTGKYLSDAQEAIHKLRGVSNMSSKPIMEGSRRSLNGSGKSQRAYILEFLAKDAKKTHTVDDVIGHLTANGISTTRDKTRAALDNCVQHGWARKPKSGQFAISSKGVVRVKASSQQV